MMQTKSPRCGRPLSSNEGKIMKRSTDRILTTHVGSLIRPPALQEIMRAKQGGQSYDQAAYEACLKQSVADVVGRQAETGVDVVSDGEFGKAISWNQYVVERLSGFELRSIPPGYRPGTPGADRTRFKEFYAELDVREPMANAKMVACVGPVKYIGQAILKCARIARRKTRVNALMTLALNRARRRAPLSRTARSRKPSCRWWRRRACCRTARTSTTRARPNGSRR
jgi:hypothetical protein